MKKFLTAISLAVILAFISVFSAACNQSVLPTPNIYTVDIDESYRMTWESVANARGYAVEVTGTDDFREEKSTHVSNYDLSGLEEGDYEIRIRAVGGGGYGDSDWSDIIYFHKDYENGCIYEQVDNGTAYQVARYGSSSGTVDIGATYRGKPVVAVKEGAFRGSYALENIIIGPNVTTIGDNAFYGCSNLRSVTFPETLTYLGSSAFQACFSLNDVTIPAGITYLSDNLFNFCRSLTNVQLPDIVSIGAYAFANCSALTDFTIPDSVVSVGEYAFFKDVLLETITVGSGVQVIGNNAFELCSALTEVVLPENNSLIALGGRAFSYCTALTEIALPEGLVSIGNQTFLNCVELRDVHIPSSVTAVGQFAFLNTGIYEDAKAADETYVYVDDWLVELVEMKQDKVTVVGEASIDEVMKDENFVPLKEGLKGIAAAVFYGCPQLTRVFLPDTVEYINASAFYECPELWYFEASDNSSLREIGSGAFAECQILRTIYLGNSLESIGSYAFLNCSVLENNTISSIIPESVTNIGMLAFYGTTLYENPDEYGVIYAGNWAVGYEGYDTAIQYVAYELGLNTNENAWMLQSQLSKVTYIELREDTRGIADYAFYGHMNLEQVDGMSTPRYMGEAAFFFCDRLSTISLNRSMTAVPDYAFYGCERVLSVSLPAFITEIGRSAFYGCSRLSEVVFSGNRLEKIGDFAFYNCINLPSIQFGNSLEELGGYAFYNCTALGSVTLPDSLVSIGDRAFYQCSGLSTLDLGQGVTEIGDYAFGSCSALTSVVIPDSVEKIGNYAFYGCSGVTELDLGSVKTIGDNAFARMTSLTSVEIPASVESIGGYAFRGCRSLTTVNLSGNVEEIGVHTFFGCDQATIYTDAESIGAGWDGLWNSSYRPVVWGCELAEDGGYIVSVTVGTNTFTNIYGNASVSSPVREGYVFAGWALTEGGDVVYNAGDAVNAREGTILYAVWQQS